MYVYLSVARNHTAIQLVALTIRVEGRGYQCHGRKGASFSIFPCSGWALSVSLPIRYTVAALGLSGGVPETVAKFLVVMASKMTKDSG